jgi:hypothetical protein
MGQRPTQAGAAPLGQIHYLAQIRLGLELDCLGAKSPLSIYINRGRAAGVSHHVLPCWCGIEQGSVAPAWFRATSIIVLVFNSAMFSYPPSPISLACDSNTIQ